MRQPAKGLHGSALRRVRSRCRQVLLRTLSAAIAAVSKQQGPNPARWKMPATCPNNPGSCDEQVPVTAGAVATPDFPWQDRGTYHQIDELTGHR